MVQPSLVVICGPTASGKTSLALRLAERFSCEIVSADSRQIYRQMDIGTAKPTSAELAAVPHHLIDVVDPDQPFNVNDYTRLGHQAISEILARQRLPMVVGGTGLYLQALLTGLLDVPGANEELRTELRQLEAHHGVGYLHQRLQEVDPEAAARLKPRDQVRIIRALEVYAATGKPLSWFQQQHQFGEKPYRVLWLGMQLEREELYRLIDLRVERMFADGLVEEVEGLLASGYPATLKAFRTIGYSEVLQLLQRKIDMETAISMVKQNSRRYAKRQLTWFRKNPEILWVDSCREFARITQLMECFNA